MKRRVRMILSAVIVLAGLSLLLYPAFSSRWNSFHQSRVISGYGRAVAQMNDAQYEKAADLAREYNRKLWRWRKRCFLTGEELPEEYDSILNIGGSSMMGSIEIPAIGCMLPVYHGTEERTLQAGVGHVASSSLPVGGGSTHCVLVGHSGLPSARLFTDLEELKAGDLFMLHILNDTLTYRVEQTEVVLPEEIGRLKLVRGEDRCTLVTCTPYGINSHRLLVEGIRVLESPDAVAENVRTGDGSGLFFWAAVLPACAAVVAVLFFIRRKVRR